MIKDWMPFSAEDPFNPNFVEGAICRHSGDDYGALRIDKVNGRRVPQLIFCTPKLAYPFDRVGRWHFPKAQVIERYAKLDGTNVFAFRYADAEGKQYLSYKTRLLPFLQQSRFGPFLEMWKEILRTRPIIGKLPWQLDMNLSFELWGARNPHLVKYEVPLEASLLFARQGQKILPPSQLGVNADLWAAFAGSVTKDYVWSYQETQRELESGLRELEDGYSGQEGEVWYLKDVTGAWTMFKLKPESIEQIHWSAGGIGKNVIRATCENAFENWDDPTVEQVKELLLEEFDVALVEKVHFSILRRLDEAKEQHRFRQKVLTAYGALGMSILDQKREVMRALSSQFARKAMGKVFSIIWAHTVQ